MIRSQVYLVNNFRSDRVVILKTRITGVRVNLPQFNGHFKCREKNVPFSGVLFFIFFCLSSTAFGQIYESTYSEGVPMTTISSMKIVAINSEIASPMVRKS